jgi:hypothetical protein
LRDVPPAPGAKSPALWATRARLGELFAGKSRAIEATPRTFAFRYRSADHFLEIFRTFYGPVLKAFAALEPANQAALRHDMVSLLAQCNRADDGTLVVPSEYLEVVIAR